ncbi:hypothetical protein [Dictyobacter aurantiacus]|uniref:Antibiotic biosynthesis monooxygenase n=1 Tax=Dictyobacter aurantiacus TaxID=1936993 RepID=A0A401ZLX2_9CHLR|nr:hypothetical protein [Dictyobacter aurantiacus]GCE07828.1 hypothetical protein KDAU_51570 [Dictyobacter aurantiacus]
MTQSIHEAATTKEPVTLVERRILKPGHENDFYAWVQRAIAASERFPGDQGVSILTFGKEQSNVRYVVHRFADNATARAWMQSGDRAKLMQEAAAFSSPYTQTSSGMAVWFTLPGLPEATPLKWKMSLAIIPSAYIASLIILLILNAFVHGWPLPITNAVVTVFLAFLLTYIGLPVTTRLLHSWLYPQEK